MVRDSHFMATVVDLLDTISSSAENSITPCRRSLLFTRVVIICSYVILVRRCECNRKLIESAKLEPRILPLGSKQLIPFKQLGEISCLDGADNGISAHSIDSIIQITIQDAYFMIHNHAAIAAPYVAVLSYTTIS